MTMGYFPSNTCIALSISTDGFQAWKQRGFEGWQIIATILNIDPEARVKSFRNCRWELHPDRLNPLIWSLFFFQARKSSTGWRRG